LIVDLPANWYHMTRLTRSVPKQVFIWMNAPIRLRQGGKSQIFFTKILHFVQNFCEKDKKCPMLPQAILPFTG